MKKNFHYVITAVFIKNDVDVKRFENWCDKYAGRTFIL
jgi:hypothetical protein